MPAIALSFPQKRFGGSLKPKGVPKRKTQLAHPPLLAFARKQGDCAGTGGDGSAATSGWS